MNLPGLNEPFNSTGFRRLVQAVRELAQGATNAAGTFTLRPGETSTVVESTFCIATSLPLIAPTSPAAAVAAWWVESCEAGRFTIGHTMAPDGAVFRYELRQP